MMRSARRILSIIVLGAVASGCADDPPAPAPEVGSATPASVPAGDAAPEAATDATTAPGPVAATPVPLPPELDRVMILIARLELDEARTRASAYLGAHPDDPRALFLYGLTYHRERKYGEARPHFARALELDPDYAIVHHFFGYCLYNLGELDGARTEFEAHLAFDPAEADSHFGLGLVELEAGRLDEAEARFRRAIELTEALVRTDPDRYQVRKADLAKMHARLGDVHVGRGEDEAARDAYIASIRVYPMHALVHERLGQVHRRLGDTASADAALERAEEIRRLVRPELGEPDDGDAGGG